MGMTIGIPQGEIYSDLRDRAARTGLRVIASDSRSIALSFRKHEVDTAFISPIEYSRESSLCRIIPAVAVSSRRGVSLIFRKGLHSIETLAADPVHTTEIVLARIILAEEFESAPSIVPLLDQPVEKMLEKADAALVTEGSSVAQRRTGLDLAEAWSEMVGFPFVHSVLCTHRDHIPPDVLADLISLANDDSGHCAGFSYGFTDDTAAALLEFLRYAHFHGVLPDIPELNLYNPENPDDVTSVH